MSFAAMGLPTSLAISPAGLITGVPTTADADGSPFSVTVAATDTSGFADDDSFLLFVTDGSHLGVFQDGFEGGDATSWSATVP